MPGGMYRNQMWFPYEGNDVLLCLGIHGQMVYINRPAQVVAVKLSSWPHPQDASKLFPTVRAFDAIAAALLVETRTVPEPVASAAGPIPLAEESVEIRTVPELVASAAGPITPAEESVEIRTEPEPVAPTAALLVETRTVPEPVAPAAGPIPLAEESRTDPSGPAAGRRRFALPKWLRIFR
jgi:hypothetical protein